jgi:hypothetical protein
LFFSAAAIISKPSLVRRFHPRLTVLMPFGHQYPPLPLYLSAYGAAPPEARPHPFPLSPLSGRGVSRRGGTGCGNWWAWGFTPGYSTGSPSGGPAHNPNSREDKRARRKGWRRAFNEPRLRRSPTLRLPER